MKKSTCFKHIPKSIAFIKYVMLSLSAVIFLSVDLFAQITETFSTPGNHTFTVPPGITNLTVKAWGGGGGSGGHGTATVTKGEDGGATTIQGLSAGGGKGSAGATSGSPTTGGAGGTASGGTTNTSGGNGTQGSVAANASIGGNGGLSPNGGGQQNGANCKDNNSSLSGINGNSPGGGAGGSARRVANPSSSRRSTGGGGGGAYVESAFSVLPGQPITFIVGSGGPAGTGDQAAGGAGADGQVIITYNVPSDYKFWTGATNGDWAMAGNWEPSGSPASTDNVVIRASGITNWPSITSGSVSVNSLTIMSTVNGTGSLIINGGTLNKTATVQRYIPSDDWHIISSPVSGQEMGAFASGNTLGTYDDTYDLAPYDEANDYWNPFNVVSGTTTEFATGKGYLLRLPDGDGSRAVEFTGTINSENKSVALSYNTIGYAHQWNAIGNPYTSAILAKGEGSFLDVNVNEDNQLTKLRQDYAGLYIWDHELTATEGPGDYTVITSATYDFPGGESKLNQNYIAVGQGFIVKAASATSVSFLTTMQAHAIETTNPFKSAEVPWPALRLNVSSGNMLNNTIVAFNSGMTNGLDPSYDVGKLKGNPDLALYTKLLEGSESVDFAVQALPDISYNELRIPVGLDLPKGGEVTFTLDVSTTFRNTAEVYLEDTHTQSLTRLNLENANYTTTVAAGTEGAGRFNLVLAKYAATGVEKPVAENRFTVFTRDRLIVVSGPANQDTRFSLFSADGKLWVTQRAQNLSRNTLDASGFAAGIYLLKIVHNGTPQTEKLVITQ